MPANSNITVKRFRQAVSKPVGSIPKSTPGADWSRVSPEAASEIERAVIEAEYPIFLHGLQGRGKSYAIGVLCAAHGKRSKFVRFTEFCNQLRTCRISREGLCRVDSGGTSYFLTEYQFWQRIELAGLLAVDDVGLKKATDFQNELFFEILEKRIGKPTIISSNIGLPGIAELFDARIASRLSAGAVIEYAGVDRRQSQNRERSTQ